VLRLTQALRLAPSSHCRVATSIVLVLAAAGAQVLHSLFDWRLTGHRLLQGQGTRVLWILGKILRRSELFDLLATDRRQVLLVNFVQG
jgi:hypothetical protein